MQCTIHVEIIQASDSSLPASDLEKYVHEELRTTDFIRPGSSMSGTTFISDIVKEHVICVKFGDISELMYSYCLEPDNLKKLSFENVAPHFHVYHLEEEDIQSEELISDCDGENETISAANYCLLPHATFNDIWENLIFDSNIKHKLLEYASTSMIFSQHSVNTNIICWNRVVLLYGPPGTGKTSLCKGLAQKLSIRLKKNYEIAEFIEINSHSLFSKYYSESGKLVMRMFKKIRDHLEYGKSLVCVLIDEIESLTHARNSCMTGAEPSDSIRVVNAILTQLDQIRKYPNVLILTTSNLKSAIDMAFVDRADLQIFVGPPSWRAIYEIFVSCLEELIRVGIIKSDEPVRFLPINCISEIQENKDDISTQLSAVARSCEGFSGRILRKLPFLAYSVFGKCKESSIANYIAALQLAVHEYRQGNENTLNVHQS